IKLGLQDIGKIRMGCYWTAQRLAKAGLIPKMYIERCPFCNKNTPETIEHMLIECFRWNSIRHETTIFNIPRLYRTVTIDQSTNNQALNQGRNIMVGKLLGGESKETRSLLAQSRDRYSPYMKELETGRFMNGIRVVRTLILDRINGLDNAGKTTVVKKIMNRDINNISPTLGFTIDSFQKKGYTINAWDVGGQKSIRPYWKNYFEKTEGIVWVIDSVDVSRLSDCAQELASILTEQKLVGASLLVFANKQDIPGAITPEELLKILDLENIKGHSWNIFPCSAVTGDGIDEGIDWIVSNVSERIKTECILSLISVD
ncbi:hypothetical protein BB560_004820, partial [Smittium megazygosporum]